jgi:hypothetical protein
MAKIERNMVDQEFFLTPGDTVMFDYALDMENGESIPVSAFQIFASETCRVIYSPMDVERVKHVRTGSLQYYRDGIQRYAEKHGKDGGLTAKQIDEYFEKEVFYNRLRYED